MEKPLAADEYPYRFKFYDDGEELEKRLTAMKVKYIESLSVETYDEDDLAKMVAIIEDVGSGVLSSFLEGDEEHKREKEYFLFGTYLNSREKNLLQYLMCLRYGLPRSEDVERRIHFGKISYLVKLMSPTNKLNLLNRRKIDSMYKSTKEEGKRRKMWKTSTNHLATIDNKYTCFKPISQPPMIKNEDSYIKEKFKSKNQTLLRTQVSKGLHATTGCDTTSSFNGIGKVKCYKIMESEKAFIDAMPLLGEAFQISNTLVGLPEWFVYRLYETRNPIQNSSLNKSKAVKIKGPRQSNACQKKCKKKVGDKSPPSINQAASGKCNKKYELLDESKVPVNNLRQHGRFHKPKPKSELINESHKLSDDSNDDIRNMLSPSPCFGHIKSFKSELNHKELIVELPALGDEYLRCFDKNLIIPNDSDDESLCDDEPLSLKNTQSSINERLTICPLMKQVQFDDDFGEIYTLDIPNVETAMETFEKKLKKESSKTIHKLPKVPNVVTPRELVIKEKKLSKKGRKKKNEGVSKPIKKKLKPKIEVDLGVLQSIHKIIFQLESDERNQILHKIREKSASFTLEYSSDCIDWMNYNDTAEEYLVFGEEHGNLSCILNNDIVARYIRIRLKNLRIQNVTVKVEPIDPLKESLARRKIREGLVKPIIEDSYNFPLADIIDDGSADQTNIVFTIPLIPGTLEEADLTFDDELKAKLSEDIDSPERASPIRNNDMFPNDHVTSTPQSFSADKESERLKEQQLLEKQKKAVRQKVEAMFSKKQSLKTKHDNSNNSDQKNKKYSNDDGEFFQKYCVISKEKEEYYSFIFEVFQEDTGSHGKWLKTSDALDAMNCANNSLVCEGKKDYIIMMLGLLGIPVEEKVDLQTFMLLVAFSEKILSLGDIFHLSIENIDFVHLFSCMSRAKQMYEILLRPGERTIHVEDFSIELKAANVNEDIVMKHISMDNEKQKFDFLDYLAYFPLFLFTHNTIKNYPVS